MLKILELDILKILMARPGITIEKLDFLLEASSGTIRLSLENLKKFSKKYSMGELKKVNKKYYFIPDNEHLKDAKPNLTNRERLYYLLLLLVVNRELNLTQVGKELDLNRVSLNADVINLRKFLKKYNLKIESIPWKGVILVGEIRDIAIFSTEVILKFFIEYHFNYFLGKIYKKYVNPMSWNILNEYISSDREEILRKTTIEIIDIIKESVGLYMYSYIKSFLFYNSLYPQDIETQFLKELEDKKFHERYLEIKKKIKTLSGIKKLQIDNIDHLSYVVAKLEKDKTFLKEDPQYLKLKDKIESFYSVSLSLEEEKILSRLYDIAIYKQQFGLCSFNNSISMDTEIYKSIYGVINLELKKNKIKFYKEDYSLIILFIYQTVTKHYRELSKNYSFLIVDSATNNWVAQGFKKELSQYLPKANIEIRSIYSLVNKTIDKDIYDYVLFTNLIAKDTVKEVLPHYLDKIRYIQLDNFFQISDFWGHLIFGLSPDL